ncbi:structural protein [Cellulophaga phage phi40:1]|uniref:Structural protein n=1 Tax=Cellulophaga phage phi38:1 TaxID=1327977 RepID=S0A027_9CAUD|nr:virion structural protein [Cellulophaga phage phi38:1]AGO47960.1 structural protein [Cellulophaga phage phi40:1]AGO48125.1 structural protein [Cellulophaga phage phi38:1]
MINKVFDLLKTIVNKEVRGNVPSPDELNLIAKQVQSEIFRAYFEDENRDKIKQNRGATSSGYSNLAFNQRQKIDQFSDKAALVVSTGSDFLLPDDLYQIKDNGLDYNGKVISEMEGQRFSFANTSLMKPSETFPTYERYGNKISVSPNTITSGVTCRYTRIPKDPKWTYSIAFDREFFNPSADDFQDFELHESEFSNIVVRMLSYLGIHIREVEVTQYAEKLKEKTEIRDEQ